MADPITLDQAIADLAATWAHLDDDAPGDVRQALAAFLEDRTWGRHPVAEAMRYARLEARPGRLEFKAVDGRGVGRRGGTRAWNGSLPAPRTQALSVTLADLDALPESAPERSAVLTASAYTARQERDRLRALLPAPKASQGKEWTAQADAYAEHHARALAMLPAAFGAWMPGVRAEISSARVPAFPTVPATPTMRVGLGRAPAASTTE